MPKAVLSDAQKKEILRDVLAVLNGIVGGGVMETDTGRPLDAFGINKNSVRTVIARLNMLLAAKYPDAKLVLKGEIKTTTMVGACVKLIWAKF